ncbi:alpha/beta-hydrolase [Ophiobolus disseminans]|uniref:Alpha/beta-hydrolase n=1 Tax=Ophiobolus disseminans TaxID=1469910 RepID=A0A6A7A809_9PLEO|nr:alpha/beta-hydrolase [Ophiobolus disseminans]
MVESTNLTARYAPALDFERAGYATGPVTSDPFYAIDAEWDDSEPGTVFRVESMNTSEYTLPPGVAGVRILYQSENLNGTRTLTSGAILFPYTPLKSQDGGNAVVVWAHGTSGLYANAAPSHLRNLWQHYIGPFPLALHGYIVIMPDYSGLGVSIDGKGKPIVHEYLDYGFKAAFAVMGHSQGGGVAWSFAERMHTHPVAGYLGSIPISPVTKILSETMPLRAVLAAGTLWGIENIFPDFDMNTILTEAGKERMQADKALDGNAGITKTFYLGADLFVPGWKDNEYVQRFNALVHSGGRPIAGPMLLIQGENDPLIFFPIVRAAAEETVIYSNISHVPANWVSQRLWLDWIRDRFEGKQTEQSLKVNVVKPLRPADTYASEMNWYVGFATEYYHTP